MKLYYAHYPALEEQFVRFVRVQRANPVDKWLVICASSLLAQHLQRRLAREMGVVANMHFMTGGGLVMHLDSQAPGETLPLFPQNHLRDFLIEQLLREPGLNRYALSGGFVEAVKSALRDLEDSLAEPEVLEEHWQSMPDFVLQEDDGRFSWLVRLYKRYRQAQARVPGYRPYQDAFERALRQVETSSYLGEFSHIIFYGFYDMPGRQWELLSRVRACYPVTVFAPYEKHPAYGFARKFFETNWLSAPGAQDVNTAPAGALGASAAYLFAAGGSAPNQNVHIVSVPDVRGAVFLAAKEIAKRLAAKENPADMAVMVRNMAPYQDEICRVFADNKIALDASFTYPFTHYGLGQFLLGLLGLRADGFSRQKVLAVFASPYFKEPNKHAWQRAVQKSAVKRDLSQWEDLLPQEDPAAREVKAWITQTARQLQALSAAQPWQEGAQALWQFFCAQTDCEAFEGKDSEIFDRAQSALAQLNTYAFWRERCAPEELLRQAQHVLSELTFNQVQAVRGGVTVTDVLRARGVQFKTVFLLGLNDKEFPLLTPEDPILRDYYRVQLRDTLGYWINPSLDRGDEEKLLFYSAATSATQTLYVTYARYGADGKPAVPSAFVAQLARACELNLQAADAPHQSGQPLARVRAYDPTLWTEQEIALQLALLPAAEEQLQKVGLLPAQTARSLHAAKHLCADAKLGPYDGTVRAGEDIFARQAQKGFSASALQELGACPLKYFFHRVLYLGQPDEPASRHELPADKRGTAYHAILCDFYQSLQAAHLTHNLFAAGAAEQIAKSMAKFLTPASYKAFGIYPVVWELLVENIRQKLTDFVTQDLAELGPFTPSYFEFAATARPSEEIPLPLRGVIDRIDIDETTHRFYIADYKSGRKSSSDLAQDVFTRLLLQPFLYVVLAKEMAVLRGYSSAGSCLLSIDPYKKTELSAQQWQEISPKVSALLKQLAQLIKQGTFFISPGDACTYCPYAMLCRKDAFRPLLRARQSAPFAALEEVRR